MEYDVEWDMMWVFEVETAEVDLGLMQPSNAFRWDPGMITLDIMNAFDERIALGVLTDTTYYLSPLVLSQRPFCR